MDIDLTRLLALPPSARIRLAKLLWASVGDAPDLDTLPLEPWQRDEIDSAIAEYEADPGAVVPADVALEQIRRSLGLA